MENFRQWALTLVFVATIWTPGAMSSYALGHSQQLSVNAGENKLDPTLLREDFQVLRKALEEGDSGIYRYVPKQQMDSIFDKAYARIDHPMDELEFYRIAAPVVGAIRCGHTRFLPPVRVLAAASEAPPRFLAAVSRMSGIGEHIDSDREPLFPADVLILNGNAYILRDFAASGQQLVGAEIISINNVPITRILRAMEAVYHGDGNIPTRGPWLLSHQMMFATALYTILGIQSPFHVDYRPLHGKRIMGVILEGKPLPAINEMSPQHGAAPPVTEVKFIDHDAIAVLKISSFSRLMTKDLLKNSFEQIHSHGSTTLILDLRGNHGGQDDLGRILFSYLTTEPFKYYNDLVMNPAALNYLSKEGRQEVLSEFEKGVDGKLHWVKHPNWGTQQPTQPVFTGKVFVLMDGGSFSTTCEFLSVLDFHHRAVFIGEEAGGDYYGNTSGIDTPVFLPHSHLMLQLNMVSYYVAVSGYAYPDRGVMPNYPVKYSIEDRLDGADKDMALALDLARHPEGRINPRDYNHKIIP